MCVWGRGGGLLFPFRGLCALPDHQESTSWLDVLMSKRNSRRTEPCCFQLHSRATFSSRSGMQISFTVLFCCDCYVHQVRCYFPSPSEIHIALCQLIWMLHWQRWSLEFRPHVTWKIITLSAVEQYIIQLKNSDSVTCNDNTSSFLPFYWHRNVIGWSEYSELKWLANRLIDDCCHICG